jgi:hypothetical protein
MPHGRRDPVSDGCRDPVSDGCRGQPSRGDAAWPRTAVRAPGHALAQSGVVVTWSDVTRRCGPASRDGAARCHAAPRPGVARRCGPSVTRRCGPAWRGEVVWPGAVVWSGVTWRCRLASRATWSGVTRARPVGIIRRSAGCRHDHRSPSPGAGSSDRRARHRRPGPGAGSRHRVAGSVAGFRRRWRAFGFGRRAAGGGDGGGGGEDSRASGGVLGPRPLQELKPPRRVRRPLPGGP